MEPLKNPANFAADVLRNAAVAIAWEKALQTLPALSLLDATGGALKRAMADAVDNALAAGVVDLDELISAATSRVPKLRTPNGTKPQVASDQPSSNMAGGT